MLIYFRSYTNRLTGGFFIVSLLVSFGLLMVSGCSTNPDRESPLSSFYKAYNTLSSKQTVTKSQSATLPYAMLQVSLDKNHNVLMPLGHIADGKLKWYSKDRFGFTTQSSRITQIYNVKSELSSIQADTLWRRFELQGIALNQRVKLPVSLDFLTLNRFGVEGSLTIQGVRFEERILWGEPVMLLRIEEVIQIPAMDFEYTNRYWKDTRTNFIWESVQKWGPNVPEIHYQVVKPWREVTYP